MPGFLNVGNFLTQKGQLKSTYIDDSGQTVASAVTTVDCLVYTENNQNKDAPLLNTGVGVYYAVFRGNVTVQAEYHLSSVVDRNGNTVLADARIVLVRDLNHHRFGTRTKEATLEITRPPL